MKTKPIKHNGKLFRYDYEQCEVEYVHKATKQEREENEEWLKTNGKPLFEIDADGYYVLDSIGLSKENWRNKENRTAYLDEYCFNLDEELAYMVDDFNLTPEEHSRYEELQRIKAETDPIPNIEYAAYRDYRDVKNAHADDIILYQVGDFFEMYGDDAKTAAETLDLALTTCVVGSVGRVPMCGMPTNKLEQYVEKLQDEGFDVTISGIEVLNKQRRVFSLPSIDHEAERAIDAYEAEFGADGTRAFPGEPSDDVKPPLPKGDTFAIYQLKAGDATHYHRFTDLQQLRKTGLKVERGNYDRVYEAPLDATYGYTEEVKAEWQVLKKDKPLQRAERLWVLEKIYERFNIDHPADFKGHSLSVSDIVVLNVSGKETACYCDSIGYAEVPEFLSPTKEKKNTPQKRHSEPER